MDLGFEIIFNTVRENPGEPSHDQFDLGIGEADGVQEVKFRQKRGLHIGHQEHGGAGGEGEGEALEEVESGRELGADGAGEEAGAAGNGEGEGGGREEGGEEMEGREEGAGEELGVGGEEAGDLGRGEPGGEEEGVIGLEGREGVRAEGGVEGERAVRVDAQGLREVLEGAVEGGEAAPSGGARRRG